MRLELTIENLELQKSPVPDYAANLTIGAFGEQTLDCVNSQFSIHKSKFPSVHLCNRGVHFRLGRTHDAGLEEVWPLHGNVSYRWGRACRRAASFLAGSPRS